MAFGFIERITMRSTSSSSPLPAASALALVGRRRSYNSDSLVKLIVGLIGIWYTADLVWKNTRKVELAPKPADIPRGLFWGTIAGFTSFVAHAGGTPYQMYALPQKMDKMTYAGTITIIFTIVNALKLPPYWMLGQINLGSLQTGLYLTPIALFGAWAGFKLTKILPEKTFFKFVEDCFVSGVAEIDLGCVAKVSALV